MQKLQWQNAKGDILDLTSGNYGITEWEGFSNTSLNIQTQTVPFQDGGVFLDALIEQRELTVTLAMQDNNNLALRYQQRRELISALNPKLGEGYLIYTNDFISKRIKCVPQIPVFETHNSDTAGTPKASLTWSACEPYWEDLEETEVSISLGDTVTINNTGDVPAQIIADIQEGCDNPILTNKTTGKNITLNAELEHGVLIDTNNGQKSIQSYKQSFQWEQGGLVTTCVYGGGKVLQIGTVAKLEDLATGEVRYIKRPCEAYGINNLFYINNKYFAMFDSSYIAFSEDGENWTEVQISGFSANVTGIAYNGILYVVVGASGKIATSTDLFNWTVQTSGSDGFADVTYSKEVGLFVTVGGSGTIKTSPDGTTWTSRTSGVSSPIYSIIYQNQFIAYGNGRYFLSPDGTTWTYASTGVLGYQGNICYGNGNYVIACTGGIVVSTDLVTWTRRSGLGSGPYDVTFGAGVFTVVSSDRINKSTDGITWTTSTLWNYDIKGAIYVNGKFIAVTESHTSPIKYYVMTSTDGINWESTEMLSSVGDIVYGNGIYVIRSNARSVYVSTDGEQWESYSTGADSNLKRIKYIESLQKFILLEDTRNMLESSDGMNWTVHRIITTTTPQLRDIDYGNGLFVVVGNTGSMYYSSDMETWTSANIPNVGTYAIDNIIYKNGFIAHQANMRRVIITTDAQTFRFYNFGTTSTMRRFVIIKGNVYGMGESGYLMESQSGIKWDKVDVGINENINQIVYKDGLYVFGDNGLILLPDLEKANFISNLSPSSDMNLNLEQGNNDLSFFADATSGTCKIKYRQKYIGV